MCRCDGVSVGMSVCRCQCVKVPVCQCVGVSVCWCVGMSVCRYAGVSVCRRVGVSVCRYVGVSVCLFLCRCNANEVYSRDFSQTEIEIFSDAITPTDRHS